MQTYHEAFLGTLGKIAGLIEEGKEGKEGKAKGSHGQIDKSLLQFEKDPIPVEDIFRKISLVLSQANVRPSDLSITQQAFTPLFALQLASILSDSPLIDSTSRDIFMSQIHAITSQWFIQIFGLLDTKSVTFFRSELESLRQVFQAALERRFDSLKVEGFPALFSRPPTIYVGNHSHYPVLVENISSSLFIPKSHIRQVPSELGSLSTKLNVKALEELINEDLEEGKTPTIIVARIGTYLTGEVDDIKAIRALCDRHNIWLHLEGNGLSLLTLPRAIPEALSSITLADSSSVHIGRWLGLQAFPCITFYRTVGFTQLPRTHFPEVFLAWVYLQSVGQSFLANQVSALVDVTRALVSNLNSIDHIQVLDRTADSQNTLFRFSLHKSKKESEDELRLGNLVTTYLFKAGQELAKNLGIDLITLDRRIFMRFQIFFPHGNQTSKVEPFAHYLRDEVKLAISTLHHQAVFQQALSNQRDIKLVQHPDEFFGLGAVRCIPSYIKDEASLSPEVVKDLNDLNDLILEKLVELDSSLFKKGILPGTDQTTVLIGVDRSPLSEEAVAHLVETLENVANEVEKSDKFILVLAEMIKKGISQAQTELQKESDQKLEEGFIKNIPIVGSLYGLFAGVSEEPKKNTVKSFSLQKGKLDRVELMKPKPVIVTEESKPKSVPDTPEKEQPGDDLSAPSAQPTATTEAPDHDDGTEKKN